MNNDYLSLGLDQMSCGSQPRCHPTAYQLLARHRSCIETDTGLEGAALAVAQHAFEDINPWETLRELEGLAQKVLERVRRRQTDALLAHLHDVFFDDEGFCQVRSHILPVHVYLPTALALRQAADVTLALIYKAVARRVGLKIVAVTHCNQFLIAVASDPLPQLIDVCQAGRAISWQELCDQCSMPMRGVGRDAADWPASVRRVSHREWLARMLVHLQHPFWLGGHLADMAAINDMLALVDSWS